MTQLKLCPVSPEPKSLSNRVHTRMIGDNKLRRITIKRRNSKNGYTTPYEIYCPQEVDLCHWEVDPCHWEKKCWITMCNKKFLLPMDSGENDESTLNMGVKQPSLINPAFRNQNVQENISSFNCFGLGSSREDVAELVKHYDLVTSQETCLFLWDLAVPSTL